MKASGRELNVRRRLVEQDVARFEVAMQHPVLMRIADGLRQRPDDPRRPTRFDRMRLGPLRQRSARHESHGQVMLTFVQPGFANRYDVGMLEPGGWARNFTFHHRDEPPARLNHSYPC